LREQRSCWYESMQVVEVPFEKTLGLARLVVQAELTSFSKDWGVIPSLVSTLVTSQKVIVPAGVHFAGARVGSLLQSVQSGGTIATDVHEFQLLAV